MDFVVVGFGLGALGVLLGLLLRDVGPWWRRARPEQALEASELIRRVAWGRGCRAAGRTLALAGGALCLMPVVALIAGLSDRLGAILVLAVLALATGGVVAWSATYAHRYHPRPLRRHPVGRATPSGDELAPAALDPPIATPPVPPSDALPIREADDAAPATAEQVHPTVPEATPPHEAAAPAASEDPAAAGDADGPPETPATDSLPPLAAEEEPGLPVSEATSETPGRPGASGGDEPGRDSAAAADLLAPAGRSS